jgi:hypothetical protein
VTTFWRPIMADHSAFAATPIARVLGDKLFALWARCDLCQHSGPIAEYHFWERERDTGTLCVLCNEDAHIVGELLADGWARAQ